ncbi:ABC transporter ATP-binding protein [Canibacter sp. lx-45]|uniref:dipeptide ABC transporter ATP-binding protein n=1 Tax=Canibacter zhuwentaonis TaxID=2837491 RepID=UPI001BDC091C|nr:ABC transporter ATP-binding protein [Canibacter zhuwentaonis]MBT1035364.1 ABC transporter ATP-binding protein [Canibacter zhuwentaonis]
MSNNAQESTRSLLSIKDLGVSYASRDGLTAAVKNVSFTVRRGEVTALVGESGSGKSTVANTVMGILPYSALVQGEALLQLDSGSLALNRLGLRQLQRVRGREVALVPQDPGNSLNPVSTVGGSIAEAMRVHGVRDKRKLRTRVLELLELVGIDNPTRRIEQYPHEFSGGMRQRVLIAAAVANNPRLLVADEPTSALDVTAQRTVLDLLDSLRLETGMGVLLITHDLAAAADRASSFVVMRAGQVVESGAAEEVIGNPQSDYTRQLLADSGLGFAQKLHGLQRIEVSAVTDVSRETFALPVLHAQDSVRPMQLALPTHESAQFLMVEKLRQEYKIRGQKEPFVAADNISFSVARSKTHAIVGESGSGKTTVGRIIAGFVAPVAGSVRLNGDPLSGLHSADLARMRRRVQLVYQNPYGSLDPRMRIGKTLAEPLRNFKLCKSGEISEQVTEALERVGLPANFAKRMPHELSGGQRQRIAIARALIPNPELVVLDEAVSALDVTVQAQILRLLQRLQQEFGLTYVFISHDLSVVHRIADTVSVMQHGRQVETGNVADIFARPSHAYTKQLLEAIPGKNLASYAVAS